MCMYVQLNRATVHDVNGNLIYAQYRISKRYTCSPTEVTSLALSRGNWVSKTRDPLEQND